MLRPTKTQTTEAESLGSRFANPTKWNAAWQEEHKDHSVVSLTHTTFSGTVGTIYKEHRCYMCSCAAQECIGETNREVEKIKLSANQIRKIHRGNPMGKMGGPGRPKKSGSVSEQQPTTKSIKPKESTKSTEATKTTKTTKKTDVKKVKVSNGKKAK